MRGSYEVVVRNSRVQFRLTVNRNLTILRGDSATGMRPCTSPNRSSGSC